MKKLFLLALAFLVVFPMSQAMLVNYDEIKASGQPGEQVSYRITLNNNEDTLYKVYLLRSSPWTSSVFPTYTFDVGPFETKEVTITFDIPLDEIRGTYLHQVDIKWDNGVVFDEYSLPLISTVVIPPYGKVKVTSLEVGEIDPRVDNYVFFRTSNTYGDLRVSMNITLLERNHVVSYKEEEILVSGGGETFNKSFTAPLLTGEGSYTVRVSLFYHGVLDFRDADVHVEGYTNFIEEKSEYVNLLGKRVEVVIRNTGTLEGTKEYTLALSGIDRYLIFSTNGQMSGTNLVWSEEIPSQGAVLLYYDVTFLPILIVAVVIVVLVFLFFRILKRVEVTKNIVDYSANQLGITIKMEVKVKNLGKGSVRDLKIYDPLPKVSHEITNFGTVVGKRVRRGMREYIYWSIEEIKPNEEIVLFYEFRIKIGVIGKMVIEPTEIYYTSVGREFLAKSNEVVVQITPEEEQ
jgi:hypothetical protein